MELRVIQINLGKRDKASEELVLYLDKHNIHIALVQEPCCRKSSSIKLDGGMIYYRKTENRPRTCIWVKRNLMIQASCILMSNFSDSDLTTVKIKMKNSEIIFSSGYLPHLEGKHTISNPISEKISKLVDYCSSNNVELVFGTDSNSHHVIWGSEVSNKRGENVVEFMVTRNLRLINEGNRPTWSASWESRDAASSVIDLTIATDIIGDKIKNWKTCDEILSSDHRLISFEVSEKVEINKMRSIRKTDWEKFRRIISRKLKFNYEIEDIKSLDQVASKVNSVIVEAYRESCKVTESKTSVKKTWMNMEILTLKRRLRKLEKKAYEFNRERDISRYKKFKKEYHRMIDEARFTSWKKKTQEINDIKEISRLQKFFETGPKAALTTLRKDDNTFTNDLEETLELLMKKHFPDCEVIDMQAPQNDIFQTWRDNVTLRDIATSITKDKVNTALKSFGSYKSPGMDGIYPIMLQEGCESITPHLVKMFRASAKMGYVPHCWRGTRVAFIPKPGKDNYDDPKSYRPISLMSFVLKALEKIIEGRIRNINIRKKPLQRAQHAYQKGKGTDTAIHDLTTFIDKAKQSKESCLVVSIDIAGAFDNTSTELMLRAADNHDIEAWVKSWIKSMLVNRETSTMYENFVKKFRPKKGCPQGGCLSPLLWSMVIDELIKELCKFGFKVVAYADDVAIAVKGKFIETLCERMKMAMRIVERWCQRTGLLVNPIKTTLVNFTNKRNQVELMKPIKIFGTEIRRQSEFKYLGIILDEKLNFTQHIQGICTRALRSLWATRAMVRRNWGINPKMMLWLYEQVITPRITHGAIAWWDEAQRPTKASTLDKVQRLAMLMVTGCTRTTPTAALSTMLNVPPLEVRIRSLAQSTYVRLKSAGNWCDNEFTTRKGSVAKHIEGINQLDNTDFCLERLKVNRNFETSIGNRDEWMKHCNVNDDSIVWFTDGSKRDGKTASGIYRMSDGYAKCLRISDYCTVMQAEVMAIEMCVDECIKQRMANESIKVLIDSQAAIKAIDKEEITSKTVLRCKKKIAKLAEENRIELIWVPGHADVYGNEMADKVANLGTMKDTVDNEGYVSFSEVRRKLKSDEHKRCMKAWEKATENKLEHSKIFIDPFSEKKANEIIELGKKDIRIVTGILTGHCPTNKFLCMIGVVDNELCRYCQEEPENMRHIVIECNYLNKRRAIWLGMREPEIAKVKEINIKTLLDYAKIIGLDKIFEKTNRRE